mgnify:CR=1 FL=1
MGLSCGRRATSCQSRFAPPCTYACMGKVVHCTAWAAHTYAPSCAHAPTRTHSRARVLLSRAQTYGDINSWDVSEITDLSFLFCGRVDSWAAMQGCREEMQQFNSDINAWDVSSVTALEGVPSALDDAPPLHFAPNALALQIACIPSQTPSVKPSSSTSR